MITQSDFERLEQYVDGTLTDKDAPRLRELLRSSAEARSMLRSLATIDFGLQDIAAASQLDEAVIPASTYEKPALRQRKILATGGTLPVYAKTLLAIAATTIVALAVGLYLQHASLERQVAEMSQSLLQPVVEVRGLGGPIYWTGNGGQMTSDLAVGQGLTGGTIEGLTPGSWIELEFADGSTATIYGNSMLTYSDRGQKILCLKEGSVSAKVNPQPAGRPMLVHTRTAVLRVLGTQFKVETDPASTLLDVNEGTVSIERRNDGHVVDVPANHRVLASPGSKMLPELIPDSVGHWKSQLHLGPADTIGKWAPKTDTRPASLQSIPYIHTSPQGTELSQYLAAFSVSRGQYAPVILSPGSMIRVRGSSPTAQLLVFGVTVRRTDGGFGGNFFAVRSSNLFQDGENFDAWLKLEDLNLDPTLLEKKDELAKAPSDGIIEAFWCATTGDTTGMEIHAVELGVDANDQSKSKSNIGK